MIRELSKDMLAKIEASRRENRQQAFRGIVGMLIVFVVVVMLGTWVGEAYQRKQHEAYSSAQDVSWVIASTKGETK